jgi:NAD(P)-dependent dehydrogenase (short-subunit alcohol dehydrogenase family)
MEHSPIAPMRKFAYDASKAAVNVFTTYLAAELKECVGPRSLILTVSLCGSNFRIARDWRATR